MLNNQFHCSALPVDFYVSLLYQFINKVFINWFQNHPTKKMAVCHFNARHEMPEAELRVHLTICPDRHVIERQKASAMARSQWPKGNTDVPTYFPDIVLPEDFEEENWDDGPSLPVRIGVSAREMAGLDYIKDLSGCVFINMCGLNTVTGT